MLNDPNGFIYHDGVWHLFYQWCPWGAVHGLKYWYHVTSSDLISWENQGVGLRPDTFYDNRGNHSGSGISVDGKLYFFYTGNHRDEDWTRTPYTCAAVLEKDGVLRKFPKPLFTPRKGYTEHQRDPKIVYRKDRSMYYIFIGAQSDDLRGKVLIYQSKKLEEGWVFAGELKVPGYEAFGGMWECPCMEHIGEKDVFIFSLQYTKLPGRDESTNHNLYMIGNMDYETLTFVPESGYHHLDYGFDFYAAQTAANVKGREKAILIGWMGLPDNHYPTEEEDWEGSLSLPRELRVEDGHLIQTPVEGIEKLRRQKLEADGMLPKAGEMLISVQEEDFHLKLFAGSNGEGGMDICYNAKTKICSVDRTGLTKRFNQHLGEILEVPLVSGLKSLRIFIDHSSVEIFLNDGEKVFTSHVYPTEEEHHYVISQNTSITLWDFYPSVTDDFVI